MKTKKVVCAHSNVCTTVQEMILILIIIVYGSELLNNYKEKCTMALRNLSKNKMSLQPFSNHTEKQIQMLYIE